MLYFSFWDYYASSYILSIPERSWYTDYFVLWNNRPKFQMMYTLVKQLTKEYICGECFCIFCFQFCFVSESSCHKSKGKTTGIMVNTLVLVARKTYCIFFPSSNSPVQTGSKCPTKYALQALYTNVPIS